MAKKIVRPIKGMDLDSAPNRRSDDTIYKARNLRLNSKEENKLGEYTNVKGINKVISVDQGYIVGSTKVSTYIVLFISGSFGADIIARVSEAEIPKNGEGILALNTDDYYWNSDQGNTYHKVFEGDLSFSTNILKIKSYYESSLIQKVYWTSTSAPLRSLNIIKSEANDPSSFNPIDLEIIPSVDLSAPVIETTTSGSLSTGKIYYSYALVNSNGAETNVSELSKAFHLTKSSEKSSNDYNYKGYGIDVDSGKGINLLISDIPSSFTGVKVYSIHYIDDVSAPVVKLIYNGAASGDLRIIDTGIALQEITSEEFATINNLLITDGALEIKNNRLFVANYQEEFFDIDDFAVGGYWDARAYRFSGSGTTSTLYDKDLVTYKLLIASNPDYDSIPKTWDCINKDNSPEFASNTITINDYYQSNQTTLGAEGLNVNINQAFRDRYVYPDWLGDDVKWAAPKTNEFNSALPADGYASYANPKISSEFRSFKPEEVYRVAVQFKNNKQQYSYVKWICDYKIAFDNTNNTLIHDGNGKMRMAPIRLKFGVNNIPTDPDTGNPFEFRIMYVPISDVDQSATWGLFTQLSKSSDDDKFRINQLNEGFPGSNTNTGKYLDFTSLDYSIGIKKDYSYIRPYQYCSSPDYYSDDENNFHVAKLYDFFGTIPPSWDRYLVNSQYDIEYSPNTDEDVSLDGSDIFSRGTPVKYFRPDGGENQGRGNKGRSQIIYQETPHGVLNLSYFGCAYSDVFESQYGGLSFESRANSGYIALSPFMTNTFEEVYGDSFLGIFEYLRIIAENAGLTSSDGDIIGAPEIIIYPTISRINMNLRSDDMFTKIYTKTGSYMIHEYSGIYEDSSDINPDEDIFTQETDLYLYNNTYSREQDLSKWYEKQDGVNFITDFNNRIIASDQKILGEQSDSFLKFNAGTFIDTDGQYGDIQKLVVFKDRLYFFQENAIGIVSVSERSATSQQDGSTLVIGELGVLSRYDYLTKEYGINNINHVTVSENAIYFVDEVRKQFLRLTQNGIEEISIRGNIDSYVKSANLSKCYIVYNRKNNEVLFTFRNSSNSFGSQEALVFSELTGSFSSIIDIKAEPIGSEKIDKTDFFDELLMEKDLSGLTSSVYSLNDGDYNSYNGTFIPSLISLIFNPGQEEDVLFNIVEFIANQSDDGFIDTIRLYNDNYDTGEMDVDTVVESKFGKFRTSKLRGYVTPGNKERILDNHIYLTITTKDNSTAQSRVYFRDFIVNYSQYNYFG